MAGTIPFHFQLFQSHFPRMFLEFLFKLAITRFLEIGLLEWELDLIGSIYLFPFIILIFREVVVTLLNNKAIQFHHWNSISILHFRSTLIVQSIDDATNPLFWQHRDLHLDWFAMVPSAVAHSLQWVILLHSQCLATWLLSNSSTVLSSCGGIFSLPTGISSWVYNLCKS